MNTFSFFPTKHLFFFRLTAVLAPPLGFWPRSVHLLLVIDSLSDKESLAPGPSSCTAPLIRPPPEDPLLLEMATCVHRR